MTSPAQPHGHAVSPDRLRVQLRPRGSDLPTDTLVRRYDSNFDIAVVTAHDGGLVDLTVDQAATWDMPADEIGKLAVRQTILEELTEVDTRDHTSANGMSTRVIAHDGNPFVNVVLMSLERFTPGEASHGALVAIPKFSAVILHEVRSRDVLQFLVPFSGAVQSMYDDSGDSFSTDVYWWVARRYHRVRIERHGDERAQVHLPDALREVVAQLG